MKIALLNVKYSPNLGDGIIAECFEHALSVRPSVAEVTSCDLAGRTQFGDGIDCSRQVIFSILDLLPGKVRELTFAFLLRRVIASKLRAHYATTLSGNEAVIVGGGQLIADTDLNFPLKISAALNELPANNTTLALHGVGVAHGMGKKGRQLFDDAFKSNLVAANVRDRRSVERWNQQFDQPEAQKVWDPGFLSSEVYGAAKRKERARPCVGIGITHPATLSRHADSKSSILRAKDWIAFYKDLVADLSAQNCDIDFFTNGASDDASFAAKIYKAVSDLNTPGVKVTLSDTPRIPAELAHTIAKYDAIVAHRLHANVIAYSYGVPHIGFGWDSKMQGFFEETGRSKYLVKNPQRKDVAQVVRCVMDAMDDKIDHTEIKSIQADIHAQISDLVDRLLASRTYVIYDNKRFANADSIANDNLDESWAVGN